MNAINSVDHEALQKARRRSRYLLIALIGFVLIFLVYLGSGDGNTNASSPLVKKAVAVIKGPTVEGTVFFTQASPNSPVQILGHIKNVSPNADRGFHIHELGDVTNGCMSAGSHYNPEAKTHGAPEDSTRHVGDLGNVRSNSTGVVALDISDREISLNGKHSIIGRTVVIHEGTDDLGRGNNGESLKTGNAGGRAGCAVIGIAAN